MSYTKGEWKVEAEYNVYNLQGDYVCSCGVNGRDPEIGKANARLISAAPELLEACYKALEAFRLDTDTVTIIQRKDRAYELIKQAISKAEGKDEPRTK